MLELSLPTMTCGDCGSVATKAIKQTDPQARVEIDLDSHHVRVETTQIHDQETSMKLKTLNPFRAMCLVPLTAIWLAWAPAQAQTAAAMTASASMPMGTMHKGAAGPHDMKSSMTMGLEGMQKMPMSGDTDKDFAMMMKLHHRQALNMAEMESKPRLRVPSRATRVPGCG